MPLIECHLSAGLPRERLRRLMADIVETTARTLGADPRTITVVIHEHTPANIRELDFVPARDPSTH